MNLLMFLKRFLQRFDLELFFLVASLLFLALSDPGKEHFSLCIFKLSGFNHCPGCGLGHSITWFFHGELAKAYENHFFGIPAVLIMLHRIIQLVRKNLRKYNFKNLIKQS